MARLASLLGGAAAVALGMAITPLSAAAAPAGDSPAGFWYGTDSATVRITGHVPYQVPVIGGTYGGYIGMTGNWANLAGCHKIVVWSAANAAQANANYAARYGVGTGVYWFMGGPGVDPHYNGTAAEAYAWGARQAARTLYDISHLHVTYPIVFMDIEIPGNAPNYTPAPDNGWNTVYTSACSGRVRTYSSLARPPAGWCLRGTSVCAQFFGGQTSASKYAVMWQWSGGGGSRNGYGDFDQIDANRTP